MFLDTHWVIILLTQLINLIVAISSTCGGISDIFLVPNSELITCNLINVETVCIL